MIETLDGVIELRTFFLRELRFHLSNLAGESLPVDLLDRGCDIGEQRQPLLGNLGEATGYDDLLLGTARRHGQDSRPYRSHDRRVTGEHTEIAFGTGNVDLINLAREGEFFRRDEIKMKGGHEE